MIEVIFWTVAGGVILGCVLTGLIFLAAIGAEVYEARRPIEKDCPPLTEQEIRDTMQAVQQAAYNRTKENMDTIRKVVNDR